ncbi:MAG: HAMP domain-containing sensor histidine kinase [Anaerolineales bacterium]|nr:MAG: HAMP domain-containing sensor histidine kinase [Anaerolineales bacterium]
MKSGRPQATVASKVTVVFYPMFTSLRSRLWLSYAMVITLALGIVIVALLVFLIRNPGLYRETTQRLRNVQTQLTDSSRGILADTAALQRIAEANNVRLMLFDSSRALTFDSNPEQPSLPFPRKTLLNRTSQYATDAEGGVWLHAISRLPNGSVLVVAAPRPTIRILNVFADELLTPILQGGLLALLLSLVLAFALSRWVADPLQKVVRAARNYPADAKPVAPRGPREVQDLTNAFNSMVARVESAQRSQRDFVADVSHELKTPLTSIQGFAQSLLDGTAESPEARRQAAQVIYDEAGRMHRMALDLLDLARLEAGTADLNMSPVEAGALLRGVAEKFSLQVQKANVALQVDVPEGLPVLIGDGDRLSQVFTNLVDNALKFTSAGGRVTLSAREDGGAIQFEVADSGVGVESEALPRLFDRFYQADPSRARNDRHGAGLGLAIAREIVQAHGGKIGVRSSVGHGTTFTIRLPLKV